ncbi:MAG: hypothetical protein WAX89_03835 [Alphaproteobacteria bacterium]
MAYSDGAYYLHPCDNLEHQGFYYYHALEEMIAQSDLALLESTQHLRPKAALQATVEDIAKVAGEVFAFSRTDIQQDGSYTSTNIHYDEASKAAFCTYAAQRLMRLKAQHPEMAISDQTFTESMNGLLWDKGLQNVRMDMPDMIVHLTDPTGPEHFADILNHCKAAKLIGAANDDLKSIRADCCLA